MIKPVQSYQLVPLEIAVVCTFNTGACNACDIEIMYLTPTYDIERFGMQQKGTPRHADILLCSGCNKTDKRQTYKSI